MGQNVESPILIEEQAVIAGPHPVAIPVDQRCIECQKPQGAIDIQNRIQCRLQLVQRCLSQHLGQLDEGFPVFCLVFGLDREDLLVTRDVVAHVLETAPAPGAPRNFPASPFGVTEMPRQKILVELLDIHIQAPAFAVDHHPHVVRPRGGNVLPGDVRIERGVEECRILMRIQQIQRLRSQPILLLVDQIEGDIQRPLVTGPHHSKRRHAAKLNPHHRVRLAIHREVRRDIHIGAVEVRQLFFPLIIFKIDEEGPDDIVGIQVPLQRLNI